MAKASDDRSKATQSKLGRGLGSLIPVPIQRPAAPAPTGTSPAPEPPVETSVVPASAPVAPAAPVARTREIAAVEPKPSVASRAAEEPKDQVVVFIPVRAVQPGKYQPRGSMDPAALETLARSIEQSGLMQPVVVRALAGEAGRYELIAGERRWRAMDRLGKLEIPAIIQAVDDRQAAELSLIENLQREDLNPMDRASALRRLADEFAMTHQDLASRVGLDRATVSNLLRLNELDAATAGHVRSGAISMGHAKVLLGVGDVAKRRAYAEQVAAHAWSVRELEAAVREGGSVPRGTTTRKGVTKSAHLADLRRQLEEHLGTRVDIRVGRKKGAGELRIQFFSLDEFDGLMHRIGFKGDRMSV